MKTKHEVKNSERKKIEEYYRIILIILVICCVVLSLILVNLKFPDLYMVIFSSLQIFLISIGMILGRSTSIFFVFVYPLWSIKKERAIQQLEEKHKERRKKSRRRMLQKHRSI